MTASNDYKVAEGITGRVLWTRRFESRGYMLRRELWWMPSDPPSLITCAYNLRGDYIGDAKTAYRLWKRFGIIAERRKRTSNVCSIGYSRRRRRWFGWSHRAIAGFATRRQAARFAEMVS